MMGRTLCAAVLGLVALSAIAAEPATAVDCTRLDADMERAEQARRAAVEQGDNAWKAVVPFVVLARKASARSALAEADRTLAALKAQASQACEASRRAS